MEKEHWDYKKGLIYQISNNINQKIYIGSTTNYEQLIEKYNQLKIPKEHRLFVRIAGKKFNEIKWRIENKEILNKKNKEYYQKNKQQLNIKQLKTVYCFICNEWSTKTSLTRHISESKHHCKMQKLFEEDNESWKKEIEKLKYKSYLTDTKSKILIDENFELKDENTKLKKKIKKILKICKNEIKKLKNEISELKKQKQN